MRATPDNDYGDLYLDAQDDAQHDACTSYDYQGNNGPPG